MVESAARFIGQPAPSWPALAQRWVRARPGKPESHPGSDFRPDSSFMPWGPCGEVAGQARPPYWRRPTGARYGWRTTAVSRASPFRRSAPGSMDTPSPSATRVAVTAVRETLAARSSVEVVLFACFSTEVLQAYRAAGVENG